MNRLRCPPRSTLASHCLSASEEQEVQLKSKPEDEREKDENGKGEKDENGAREKDEDSAGEKDENGKGEENVDDDSHTKCDEKRFVANPFLRQMSIEFRKLYFDKWSAELCAKRSNAMNQTRKQQGEQKGQQICSENAISKRDMEYVIKQIEQRHADEIAHVFERCRAEQARRDAYVQYQFDRLESELIRATNEIARLRSEMSPILHRQTHIDADSSTVAALEAIADAAQKNDDAAFCIDDDCKQYFSPVVASDSTTNSLCSTTPDILASDKTLSTTLNARDTNRRYRATRFPIEKADSAVPTTQPITKSDISTTKKEQTNAQDGTCRTDSVRTTRKNTYRNLVAGKTFLVSKPK